MERVLGVGDRPGVPKQAGTTAKSGNASDKATREVEVRRRVGRRIAQVRKAAGKTQQELAGDAEIDTNFLSGIERGIRNPSVVTLTHIAHALATDLPTLLATPQDLGAPELRRQVAKRAKLMDEGQLRTLLSLMDAVRF